jgi:hypothetical protein
MKKRPVHCLLCCGLLALRAATGFAQRPSGWRTDTDKRSIDLAELMSGGAGKDAIPALREPRFV